MGIIHTFTALCLASLTYALINFEPCPELNANITRITSFQGTPFDCAKVPVPLDYTNPESETLELDVFRVNATEEPVLGSVLINFGGPGLTGAENLPALAEQARSYIGPQWHIVSWDPRGTGFTIPFNCNIEALSGASIPTKRDIGPLVSTNLTDVFLNGGWETAGQIADFCSTQANETGTLIGTAFVARDMIEIVDALEEDGLLRYYGLSYGTALGSYVAALFPERIERMVLDANVNPHNYAAGHYGVFANDIDEYFNGFVETCFNATDNCALYSLLQPNTPQEIVDTINLGLAPLAQNATLAIEAYLLYLGVKVQFIQVPYSPASWPILAETLAGLLSGTLPPPAPAPEIYGEASQATIGIRASDATFQANSSEEYLPQLEIQAGVSPGFSDIAYSSLWASAQWRMPAKERYFGNFDVQTKNPILYVNGNFDPVTPMVDAENATATFAGSVLLRHGGYGHTVFANPSLCVANFVQAYFINGTMPSEGAFCESDSTPTEIFIATVQGTEDGESASGGSGGGDSTADSEGPADESAPSEDAAGRVGHEITLLLAGALLAVALVVQ